MQLVEDTIVLYLKLRIVLTHSSLNRLHDLRSLGHTELLDHLLLQNLLTFSLLYSYFLSHGISLSFGHVGIFELFFKISLVFVDHSSVPSTPTVLTPGRPVVINIHHTL